MKIILYFIAFPFFITFTFGQKKNPIVLTTSENESPNYWLSRANEEDKKENYTQAITFYEYAGKLGYSLDKVNQKIINAKQNIIDKEKNLRQLAEKRARASKNLAMYFKYRNQDPTLALRIAEYNLRYYSEDSSVYDNFNQIISDTNNIYYENKIAEIKTGYIHDNNFIFISSNAKWLLTQNLQERTLLLKNLSPLNNSVQYKYNFNLPIKDADISANESIMAIIDINGNINIYDLSDSKGKIVRVQELSNTYDESLDITSIKLSADGKIALVMYEKTNFSGGYVDHSNISGAAVVWDISQKKHTVIQRFDYHENIAAIAFTPDNKLVVTGNNEGVIKLWDFSNKIDTAYKTLFLGESVTSIAFSTDGCWMAAGGNLGIVKLWNLSNETDTACKTLLHGGTITSIAISANGQHIVTGSNDNSSLFFSKSGTAKYWNIQETVMHPLTLKHKNYIDYVAISSEGDYVLTSNRCHRLADGFNDGLVKKWTFLKYKDSTYRLGNIFFEEDSNVVALSSSPGSLGNKWLVINNNAEGLGEISSKTMSTAKNIRKEAAPFELFSLSNNQTHFLYSFDKYLHSLNFGYFQSDSLKYFRTFSTNNVSSFVISPDGSFAIIGDNFGKIYILNLMGYIDKDMEVSYTISKAILKELTYAFGEIIRSIAISPNNRFIISGNGIGDICIWDFRAVFNDLNYTRLTEWIINNPENDRDKIKKTIQFNLPVKTINISPDSKWALITSVNNIVKLLDLDKLIFIQTFYPQHSSLQLATFSTNSQSIFFGYTNEKSTLGNIVLKDMPEFFLKKYVYLFSDSELKRAGVELEPESKK